MQTQTEAYKETKIFEYPNMTIRVHIPFLTDEAHKRQMKQLTKATEALLKSYKGGVKSGNYPIAN